MKPSAASPAPPLPADAPAAASAPAAAPSVALPPAMPPPALAAAAPVPMPPDIRPAVATAQMPEQLQRLMQRLEAWAIANQREAKTDGWKFWSLKIPAIIVASSAGVFASVPMPHIIPILTGLVGSICVALDGVLHPGKLRSVHVRAVHDLRTLENNIETEWDKATLSNHGSNDAAAKILEDAEDEWNRIEAYLNPADSGLQDDQQGDKGK